MLRKAVLKYILDLEVVIAELEQIIEICDGDYTKFSSNFMAVRAVERNLMIIGEAISKILKTEPEIKIANSKLMIGLRNMIVHAYDTIDPTTLWRILIKDLPVLKLEIAEIKG
ncbi:DUF86 domain-containing protein [Cryomorpha ignava]|uniref:DUF86 domain-containing protein n=1 Tax=Cryomorpha ignava TaxID=101383 RepID=A0A7K3WSF8_9FLAO|nr:HepT-like ribonuclease domain-containing protein [Cryomorpha ignava]NEN24627.1 DUF86 domain-containing protein [Cryomorpha ignava]